MSKRHVFTLVCFIVLVGALVATSDRPTDDAFSFGAVIPLSGVATSSGAAQEAGLLLAQEELAKATGTSTALFIRDSRLVPEEGKRAAQELIASGVSALYSSFTVVTREVSEIARVAETPLFYDSCNCGFAKENPHAFQLYVDPRKECRQAAEGLKTRGGTGAAFVGQDVPYAAYCIDEMNAVFGGERVKAEFDQPDVRRSYEALFASYKDDGAGFVVSLPITGHIVDAIRAAARTDIPFLCFAAQCLTPEITSELSADERRAVIAFDFTVTPAFEGVIKEKVPGITHDGIVAAAVAHDALVYAYSAYDSCGKASVGCISETAPRPLVPTAIISSGFDDDRILRYETRYVRLTEAGLEETTW